MSVKVFEPMSLVYLTRRTLEAFAVSCMVTAASADEFSCVFDQPEGPPSTYYDDVATTNGPTLKRNLSDLVTEKATRLSYRQVWGALAKTDSDPCTPDRVILLYTGRSHPAEDRNQGGRGQHDTWNREHVWPKSHGFRSKGMHAYTDIHHLRPTDTTVNSSRGNKDFQEGGDPQGEASDTFETTDTWEPRDEVKGDVARMMFYMEVRYADDPTVPVLQLVKSSTSVNEPKLGFLCTLYDWHHSDDVNDWERRRNNLIEEEQGNRNPFVDHPEWVEVIWGSECP